MKKIAVIGHFGFGTESLDGQTVKTKVLTKALCDRLGEQAIFRIDTRGWSKNPVEFAVRVWKTVQNVDHVLILPAQNGLRIFAPLLTAARICNPECKLHYSVIGGWLSAYLRDKHFLKNRLRTFDGIYVETQTMKRNLKKQGFSNIYVLPNCKELKILKPEELVYPDITPHRLCTFSRVMQEKGIEDAVAAVTAVNEQYGRAVYTLDIFGQVDPEQNTWFTELQATFPNYVRYCGTVPFDKSVDVLKDYFALLFTTRFFTEGIPGTIIDAYASGVPVIAAKWESFADMIEEGVTGYGYTFGEIQELKKILTEIAAAPDNVLCMKKNCLEKAKHYLPEAVIDVLCLETGV